MNPDPSRRAFLESLAALGCLSLASTEAFAADSNQGPAPSTVPPDAELGSLFQFIASQVPSGPAAMSFLHDRYHDVAAWKREARAKLLDLLHYAPPPCDPKPKVVEKVDGG